VGEVGDITAGDISEAAKKVEQDIGQYQPFRLDGYGDRDDHQLGIGKEVSERHKHTHHRSGSPHCEGETTHDVLHDQVRRRSTDPAGEIKEQESLMSPYVLQDPAKHVQTEHIKQDVEEHDVPAGIIGRVCEHMRGDLVGLEIGRVDRPETQFHGETYLFIIDQLGHPYQYINDYQVLHYGRESIHPRILEIAHAVKLWDIRSALFIKFISVSEA